MFLQLLFLIILAIVFYAGKQQRVVHDKKENNTYIRGKSQIKEIRFEGRFYDVTDWVQRHPGGRIIEFYVNNDEDSSIPLRQFHKRSEKKVLAILKGFKSRPIPENDLGVESDPSHREMTEDFVKLFKEIEKEGKFEPSLIYMVFKCLELLVLAGIGMFFLTRFENIFVRSTGMFILNLYVLRSGFFMHEGGHHSVTGRPGVDKIIETFTLGLGYGLSGSWWRNMHNRHHAMPQRLNHDVDLNTLPFLAYNQVLMEGNYDKYNFVLRHQAKLFALISSFGRFGWNLHTSPMYALKKHQYHELFIISLHYLAAYYMGLVAYALLLMLSSVSLLLTFSISHSHTPVTKEPRHWLEYSTIHTINVHPSWWCDYIMGYLNYQIEHHLFPTLPQFRLRAVSSRVRALALKHDLPYTCISYTEAIHKVFGNLNHVAADMEEKAKLNGIKPFIFFNGF